MAKAAIERGPVSGALEPGIELSQQLEQLWREVEEEAKGPSLKKGILMARKSLPLKKEIAYPSKN